MPANPGCERWQRAHKTAIVHTEQRETARGQRDHQVVPTRHGRAGQQGAKDRQTLLAIFHRLPITDHR